MISFSFRLSFSKSQGGSIKGWPNAQEKLLQKENINDLHAVYRFPSWSFDDWAQFELDTLEDIFKRSDGWQERALKPALSSILAPALCAVYGKQ